MNAETTTMNEQAVREPVLREVEMHLYRPNAPTTGTITRSERCTASGKAAGYVRHIEIDVSGTDLAGRCVPGQSIGVLAPGQDEKGRPHAVRLYSLASPTAGEDGKGQVISTTVKRTIDEHWDNHTLFLGVASNYLCDLQEGDKVQLTGPAGKRFVLPRDIDEHDYLFFATGTGIAPFRGMILDLIGAGCKSRITLIMGVPYATDLLYHSELLSIAEEHPNFSYITAISREQQEDVNDRLYVQDRLRTHKDQLLPQLSDERNLIYICGIAGMELGIFRQLARDLPPRDIEQYLRVDGEAMANIDAWDRKMLHKQIKTTRRIFLEVYA